MSYIVFTDDPSVHSAQEAERRGESYWPLLPMGTFGQATRSGMPVRPGSGTCPTCKVRSKYASKSLGQSDGCPSGQTLTPAGACVSVDPGTKIRKVGWIIAGASAFTVIGLFAATLTLGAKGG